MGRNRKKKNKKRGSNANESDAKLSNKERGNKLFSLSDYEGAVKAFTAGIESKDENPHVLYSNRSAANLELRNVDEAIADAEKCIELKSDWSRGYVRKGEALMGRYEYSDAMDVYKQGLENVPDDEVLLKSVEELEAIFEKLNITSEALNPDNDKYAKMCDWMKNGGSSFPKMYLQYYSQDYRGIHAITKIPAGEQILFVPITQIMTGEDAKRSDIGRKIIASSYSVRSTDSYLAAFILQEKHKGIDSPWKWYLDILPQHYANMPIYFGDDLLSLLEGSFSLEMRSDRIKSLRREYDGICKAVPDFEQFTHDEFVWARLVVITRQFGVKVDGVDTDGLVPYADMLNHKIPRQTEWTYDAKKRGFTITTLESIPCGAQIFDSYGRKCNSRFYVNYGFALEENEDNEAVIRLALDEKDPMFASKQDMLGGRLYNTRKRFQMPADALHSKSRNLFSFLRFMVAEGAELMYLSDDLTDRNTGHIVVAPISLRNEKATLTLLKDKALHALSLFISTIEEDRKLLDDEEKYPMFSNLRNTILMRYGEKKVLQYYVDLVDRALPYLDMQWKDMKRAAAKHRKNKNDKIDRYVDQVIAPLVKARK